MGKLTSTLETAFLIIAAHGYLQRDWIEVLLAISLSVYVLYAAVKKDTPLKKESDGKQ